MIPYGKQHITQADIDAVSAALQGDFLTQGPTILAFEQAFSNYIGCQYAVAVANGTAALHLSALALNVKPGQKIITTPLTFAASANCIRYCGGEVVFADIDPITYLLDIRKVEALLEAAPRGTYHGIVPVDFAGNAVNLEAFRRLADQHGLWLLEDACHAPGGFFTDSKGQNQNCGNGKYADLAIFSFHPVKHIATGEGGMITTNSETLYHKLLELRTHGITRDQSKFKNSKTFAAGQDISNDQPYPGWYMEMQTLGYNYRFTDFQAALGISQLSQAEGGIIRRRAIAERYEKAFENQKFMIGQSGSVVGHAYHLYVIEVPNRLGLYNHLRDKQIFAQIHYIPCHFMPYYRDLGWNEGDLPLAEKYYQHCISLPMYPTLTDEQQDFVIQTIKDFYA